MLLHTMYKNMRKWEALFIALFPAAMEMKWLHGWPQYGSVLISTLFFLLPDVFPMMRDRHPFML